MSDPTFREVLPWAILVQAVIGVLLVAWVWPAIGRLHSRWATFLVPSTTVLSIELGLLAVALLLGDMPTTAVEAGWWWAIAHLPSFLAGCLTYMVRQGLHEARAERADVVRAIEDQGRLFSEDLV